MEWKHADIPVEVRTAWVRLGGNCPTAECWITYHPDFGYNGGEGIYNAYPKYDFYGKPMPQTRVHADEECARLNAERLAFQGKM